MPALGVCCTSESCCCDRCGTPRHPGRPARMCCPAQSAWRRVANGPPTGPDPPHLRGATTEEEGDEDEEGAGLSALDRRRRERAAGDHPLQQAMREASRRLLEKHGIQVEGGGGGSLVGWVGGLVAVLCFGRTAAGGRQAHHTAGRWAEREGVWCVMAVGGLRLRAAGEAWGPAGRCGAGCRVV